MQKWEYMTLYIHENKKQKWIFEYNGKEYEESQRNAAMNELGKNGWELSGITQFEYTDTRYVPPPTYTSSYTLFFKRPIS
jgi:hypothetical protein